MLNDCFRCHGNVKQVDLRHLYDGIMQLHNAQSSLHTWARFHLSFVYCSPLYYQCCHEGKGHLLGVLLQGPEHRNRKRVATGRLTRQNVTKT